MKKKYFFKSKSNLQRKAIAGGLTATFAFGTVGNGFAGAMNEEQLIMINEELKQIFKDNELDKNSVQGQFKKWINENEVEFLKKVPNKGTFFKLLVSDEEYEIIKNDEIDAEDGDEFDIGEKGEELDKLIPSKEDILKSFVEYFLEKNKELDIDGLKNKFSNCLKNEYPDEKEAEKEDVEEPENEVDIRKAANDNDGIERYIRDNSKNDENFREFFNEFK